MDFSWRFDSWFDRLPDSPADSGRVRRLVVRPSRGARETPESIHVSPEGGVAGDRWSDDDRGRPGAQVSLINIHVLDSISGGDESLAPLSGDNLHVDLDLSEANLPVGTQLRIGSAVLEVSPDMHRPCGSFVERYGAKAAKKVARATRIGRRGRGVLCRVVTEGDVRVGDEIRVR
ncbi:MAG: MOSC domain-containing protein [Planctomycetota bacterium]|nr:MAG: MOSC domain-containing protein [Planctomycetota bacterium]